MSEDLNMDWQIDPAQPPEDEAYERYMAEQADQYAEYLKENIHSKYYLDLLEETLAVMGNHTLLVRTRDNSIGAYSKQIEDAKLDPELNEYDIMQLEGSIDFEISRLKEGFSILSSSRLKSDYCLILNSLENYLISVTKMLLMSDPSKLKLNLEVKLSEKNIIDYIQHPIALREFLIERVINNSDRFYNQRNVTKIIKKYIQIDVPEDEEKGLARAYEIRHKLTHLGGLIDEKLISDLNSNRIGQEREDKYRIIGSSLREIGGTYKISYSELEKLIQLIEAYAKSIDKKVCTEYQSLVDNNQISLLDEAYLINLAIDSIVP